jgi:hypothetical protein
VGEARINHFRLTIWPSQYFIAPTKQSSASFLGNYRRAAVAYLDFLIDPRYTFSVQDPWHQG